jgi:hypothetical protein
MKRSIAILLVLSILLFPLTCPIFDTAQTQDCFVQIVAVNIDQPSYQIGESVNVTFVYDLYFDLLDPLGAGSISVNLIVQGESLPLRTHQFTELGLNINKSVSFEIATFDWEPNSTGQLGIAQVQGWVQDSVGTMTDTAELQFSVVRSDIVINTIPFPTQVYYHNPITIQGSLQNPHNTSLQLSSHPLTITISQNTLLIQEWILNSSPTSTFTHEIDTSQIGTGDYDCNVSVPNTGDYNSGMTLHSFTILNSSISLTPVLNTTIVQTYYPQTNNCSILVLALLQCQNTNHSMSEANVTCQLANSTLPMISDGPNQFSTEINAPRIPGNYSIHITAKIPHHNTTTVEVPIQVFSRHAVLGFESNCSEAAQGDIIGFKISAQDEETLVGIEDKICSIYFLNQSVWNLMTQVALDQNGTAQFFWQAQNVGDQDFQFKMVFHGGPEFETGETETLVINTHEIRFILDSSIQVLRQTTTNYSLQLTTLDYQPLANVNITLIEVSTNSTWATAITNTSGYASLSWFIEDWYELGIHEFYLIAQQGTTVLGVIPIAMIVFDQTILVLI